MPSTFMPTMAATCKATRRLSPVITFSCTPSADSSLMARAASGFGGSKNSRNPSKRMPDSSAAVYCARDPMRRVATPRIR